MTLRQKKTETTPDSQILSGEDSKKKERADKIEQINNKM